MNTVTVPTHRNTRYNVWRYLISLAFVSFFLPGVCTAGSEPLADAAITELRSIADLNVGGWMFKWGDFPGPEQREYDVSSWKAVTLDYRWYPPASKGWYRTWVVVPEKIGGMPVAGSRLWLLMEFRDDGLVYIDGKFTEKKHQEGGFAIPVTSSAQPGDRISVAVHLINNAMEGGLEMAELHCDRGEPVVKMINGYLAGRREAEELVLNRRDGAARDSLLAASLNLVDVTALKRGDVTGFTTSLKRASGKMTEILDILRTEARPRLAESARLLGELDGLLDKARAKGIDVSYPTVSRTVIHNFIGWSKRDLGASEAPIVARGAGVADYLISCGQRAIAETRNLLINGTHKPIPRYTPGSVQIRNGAFYQEDTPVFLNGFGHFSQVHRDIPIFNDYGFNMIQIIISPSCVRPDSVATAPIKQLVSDLDSAAKHGIAVDLLIADTFPGWVLEQNPDMKVDMGGSLCFNIQHPTARRILKRYLDALIPAIAKHPALFSICLTNEPSYNDDGPISQREFHRWLMRKHGTIAKLNTVYGTSYTNISDVPLPTRKGAFVGESPRPIWYDWCRYNMDRVIEHHRWMRDVIHSMAPDLRVHVKIQGRVFDGQWEFPYGVDPEKFTRLGRITGGDNWSYSRTGLHRDFAQGWRRQAMFYDLQRSISPDNPIFNSENHPIQDANPKWVSGDHIRTMLWQGVMHGQGASTSWVWEHSIKQTGSIAQSILTRPNAVEASGRTALDMLRLGKEAVALQQAKADVAILFTPTSTPRNEAYLNESKNAYRGLYFCDTPIRFVTDQMAYEGRLTDYRVLVAPGNTFLPDSTTEAVTRFVRNGGMLVMAGDAFTHDEYGHKRDRKSTSLLRNSTATRDTTWKLGKGTIVYTHAKMKSQQYAALLDGILEDAGVKRDIRVTDIHHRRAWGVRTQSVKYKGGHLVYIVNLSSRAQTVKLVTETPPGSMIDLMTGEQCGPMLEMKPLVPLMLKVK
jgi:hypothetical protein